MAEIVTKFSSDDKEMIAAFQRQQKEIDKLRDKLKEAKEEGRKAGDESAASADKAGKSYQKWEGKLADIAGGYLSVRGAIAFVNNELRDQLALQDKVASTQRTAADEQIKFLRNLGIVSKQEREANLKEIAAISLRTGMNQQGVYQVAGSAMSAKGSLSSIEALKTVESAIRIAPESATEATAIAGGMLDAAALTGTSDPNINRALLIKMQEQGRNLTMSSVAQNLIPGAITLKAYGATTAQAAAATTAMTQGMKDPEGRLATTALDRLAGLAEDVTPGGWQEDIMKLRSNPKLRAAFMKKASFEKAEKFVEGFLTEGHPIAMTYDKFAREMPTAEESPKISADFEAGIMSSDLQYAESSRRRMANRAEVRWLADLKSGDYARVRAGVQEMEEAGGIGSFSRTIGATASRFAALRGQGPLESAYYGTEVQRMEMQGRGDLRSSDPVVKEAAEKQLQALLEIQKTLQGQFQLDQKRKQLNINAHVE